MVLIVAKCIVNESIYAEIVELWQVLIVAKCIVNFFLSEQFSLFYFRINSSKVYCKSLSSVILSI